MALLHLVPRDIETAGVQETRAFTMKANGKAFKVLIDGLYSDKIRAVIRELWSNAYDAHAAVGATDVPFECHLPTSLEPWFSVRDYGCSMTHEDVMGLYTTVFASSKEDSATQVGKLGLGSKSPFAYTDTFTVTAWLNGERRTYSAYIGRDHIPMIALMSTDADDAANGIEVSFPTKEEDTWAFQRAAEFTAIGFDPLPKMSGRAMDKDPRGLCASSGTGWALHENLKQAYARQGCVVYPIDVNAMRANSTGSHDDILDILHAGLIIDFPIGALEISASRESLGYDEQTVYAIQTQAQTVYDEMIAAIEGTVAAQKSLWDKMMFLNSLERAKTPRVIVKGLRQRLFGTSAACLKWKAANHMYLAAYGHDALRRQSAPKRPSLPDEITLDPITPAVVFFVDTAKPPVKNQWGRITAYMQNALQGKAYLLRYDGRIHDVKAEVVAALDGAPADTFVNMEDLPTPPSSRIGGSSAYKARVRRLSYKAYDEQETADVDMRAGGYYVPIFKNKTLGYPSMYPRDVQQIVQTLQTLGRLPADIAVYAVPTAIKSVHNPKNKWVNVLELIRPMVDDYAQIVGEALRAKSGFRNYETPYIARDLLDALPADHALNRHIAGVTEYALRLRPDLPIEGLCHAGAEIHYKPWESMDIPLPVLSPTWESAIAPYILLAAKDGIKDSIALHALEYIVAIDARNAAVA